MDNQKLVDGLVKAYWSEVETVMNYISNSVNLDGVRAEEIKKSLQAEVQDELGHAQTLAKRIKEIGGYVPGSMEIKPEQKSLQPTGDSTDVVHTIKGVIDAETQAIDHYKKVIKMCQEVDDYVTEDLVITLLADEESHRNIFEGYLKEYNK